MALEPEGVPEGEGTSLELKDMTRRFLPGALLATFDGDFCPRAFPSRPSSAQRADPGLLRSRRGGYRSQDRTI